MTKYFGSTIIALLAVYAISMFNGCKTQQEKTKQPLSVSTWEKLGPGGGGATFIPTFSYDNADRFLLRCDMTGTYLSNDGGSTYSQTNFANGSTAFAFDPKDSNTIYIGSSFLNKSSDGGKTWQQLFPSKKDIKQQGFYGDHANFDFETYDSSLHGSEYAITAIKADPVTAGYLYFSRGPLFFYSFNAGATWNSQNVHHNISSLYTNNLSDSSQVYLFTDNIIYTFNKSSRLLDSVAIPEEMAPAFSYAAGLRKNKDEPVFYALHHDTKQKINGEFGFSEAWISVNKGKKWERLSDTTLTNSRIGIQPSYSMIACAEYDAEQAYLVTNRYEEKTAGAPYRYWYGALKTGDVGKSWIWVWKGGGGSGRYGVKDGTGVANLTDAWAEKAFGGEYIRLMDVGVNPADGSTAIVTDWYRTMKTSDGGKTWNQIYSSSQPGDSYASQGLDVTTAYGVHFDPFDSSHIAISYTDIGYHHSYNNGKSWIRSVEGVPAEWVNTCYWMVFDPTVKNKIWSVWSGLHDFPRGKMTRNPLWKQYGRGGVCVSEDGGKTWKKSNEGMGDDSPATSIVIDNGSPAGNRTLYASVYGKGVFKSTDDGKTWALKTNGFGENKCAFELTLTPNRNLYVTVSPTPAYINGKKGREFFSGAVYKSTDGAETWTKLQPAEGLLFPNGIDFDPKNPDRIYLGCWAGIDLADLIGGDIARTTGGNEKLDMKGGIFLSEDAGKSWTSIFDDKQYVYDVTADPFHDGVLYCNTFNQAAYRSADYGKTWQKLKNYDFHWGQRVIIDNNDHDKVFLATYGSSVLHGTPVTE